MTQLHLKPAAGRAVPDPDNGFQLLDAAGAGVQASVYWTRRIMAHDVIEYDPAATAGAVIETEPAPVTGPQTAETPAKVAKGSKAT